MQKSAAGIVITEKLAAGREWPVRCWKVRVVKAQTVPEKGLNGEVSRRRNS
jgi:hypothetical protein